MYSNGYENTELTYIHITMVYIYRVYCKMLHIIGVGMSFNSTVHMLPVVYDFNDTIIFILISHTVQCY